MEQLQVVVVRIFADEFEDAVAAPGGAGQVRRAARCPPPAVPAAPDAVILLKPQAVGIHLVNAADIR